MARSKREISMMATAFLMAINMSVVAFATDKLTPPNNSGQGDVPTLVQQNGDGYSSITIYDGVTEVVPPQYTGETQTSLNEVGTQKKFRYYPFEITNVDEHGTWLVVKSFEVPLNVNPQTELVETDIYREGRQYVARDILQKKTQGSSDSREASKKVTITSASKDKLAILEQLDEQTFYSEGGYEGYLTLDKDSIRTEVSGTSNYSYPVTEKKEYTGLTLNDPSLIEKTITKNGVTLALSDINWMSMGSTVMGDSIVSTYKAVATYSGTGYGSKANGYIVTAEYKGPVIKEVSGDYIYSIIYAPIEETAGQRDSETENPVSDGFTDKNKNDKPQNDVVLGTEKGNGIANIGIGPIRGWSFFTLIVLIGIMLTGVGFLIIRVKTREEDEDNYDEPVPNVKSKKRWGKTHCETEPELFDECSEQEYEADSSEYEPNEYASAEYNDSVQVGDDMRVYMQGDEDILSISVDDDPELSSVFESQREKPQHKIKEPLESERQ